MKLGISSFFPSVLLLVSCGLSVICAQYVEDQESGDIISRRNAIVSFVKTVESQFNNIFFDSINIQRIFIYLKRFW